MLRAAIATLALILSAGLASAQTPADSRMKRISDTKTIKLGYRASATPFSFMPPDSKEPVGYTIDLCKIAAEAIGKQVGAPLKIEWVEVTTQNRFDIVAQGKADMECASSTMTLSRMKQVDFSSIIFTESTGIVVTKASGVQKAVDLDGKKLAVVANTTNERAVSDLIKQGAMKAVLVPVKDRDAGIAALEAGEVQGYASDKLLLVGARFKDPNAIAMLPDDLSLEPYGIVLPRGDWALRLAVNSALAEVFRSGQIANVFGRWFNQIGLKPGPLLLSAFTLGALPQ
jgi:glutamate/aspartate transport system substrate-binding protein